MKIILEIPKEFEAHFKDDRFEDSLYRLLNDVRNILAWGYDKEVIDMLIRQLKEAEVVKNEYI